MRGGWIKWIGSSSPTLAVVTSDVSGEANGTGVYDLRIDANGEALGLDVKGWSDGCGWDGLEVVGADVCVKLGPVTQPSTNPIQNLEPN